MKTVVEVFDIALLLIVLGLMLPFTFTSSNELVDMKNWGFTETEDKTLKRSEGDILLDVVTNDNLTAAEIILMTEVADIGAIKNSNFTLPNGRLVEIADNYYSTKSSHITAAQGSLDKARKYSITYDYTAATWRLS